MMSGVISRWTSASNRATAGNFRAAAAPARMRMGANAATGGASVCNEGIRSKQLQQESQSFSLVSKLTFGFRCRNHRIRPNPSGYSAL